MHFRAMWVVPILLVVSACDRKAEGQTVAVVNKEEITTATVCPSAFRSQALTTRRMGTAHIARKCIFAPV